MLPQSPKNIYCPILLKTYIDYSPKNMLPQSPQNIHCPNFLKTYIVWFFLKKCPYLLIICIIPKASFVINWRKINVSAWVTVNFIFKNLITKYQRISHFIFFEKLLNSLPFCEDVAWTFLVLQDGLYLHKWRNNFLVFCLFEPIAFVCHFFKQLMFLNPFSSIQSVFQK